MYPRFKMLIFRYKTRFFNEIFDIPRVLLGAEHESRLFFVLDLGVMVKNGLQRTDLLWDFAYKEQTWIFDVFTHLPPPVEVPSEVKTW